MARPERGLGLVMSFRGVFDEESRVTIRAQRFLAPKTPLGMTTQQSMSFRGVFDEESRVTIRAQGFLAPKTPLGMTQRVHYVMLNPSTHSGRAVFGVKHPSHPAKPQGFLAPKTSLGMTQRVHYVILNPSTHSGRAVFGVKHPSHLAGRRDSSLRRLRSE
jgi:hypothetical protein